MAKTTKKPAKAVKPAAKAPLPKKPVKKSAPVKQAAKPVAKASAPVKKEKAAPVVAVKAAGPKLSPPLPKGQIKHIAIAGNIGAGKSTLTALLSKHFGWTPNYEDVENNPYLNDFYEDMPRWSFNLQVFFLNSRFRQIIDIQKGTDVIIQDRTIHEDACIFAPNLHAMGLMSTRDFENYTRLYETISSLIRPPDLLIYLKASVPTLVNQIQKRGREYEDNLRLDYLKRLNEFYEKWINTYQGRLLVIDVDQTNFAEEEEALAEVVNKVSGELYGLF
ncbi:MAG: deoxynucleoside kinase [Bacteroidetes bacterium]|nr:deoxynucleoside kinase [Bacteroidota bacterium]